jgi:hypothetical protein
MAEEQFFGMKTADSPANVVTQGTQTGSRNGHSGISKVEAGSLAEGALRSVGLLRQAAASAIRGLAHTYKQKDSQPPLVG